MAPDEPPIDLRSDTVTRPTDAMRDAMRDAEVGNSAMGEDPTVNRLEAQAADLLGKQAAAFYPSGTMANLAALIAWTQDIERPEVVAEATAHVLLYESASMARVAGALARPVDGDAGVMDPRDVEAVMRPASSSIKPQTALVCLEQTHNQAGGVVLDPDHMAEIAGIARDRDVPVHVDGARLINASVALDTPASDLAAHGDSVMIALSKGLSAPVGSLLAGPQPFVDRARRAKALLGGVMRQSGHLAAAGLVALRDGPGFLAQDHAHARRLAEGLAKIEGIEVDLDLVQTNIVFFDVRGLGVDAPGFAEAAVEEGVGLDGGMRPHHVRAVTHRQVGSADVDDALDRIQQVADALR